MNWPRNATQLSPESSFLAHPRPSAVRRFFSSDYSFLLPGFIALVAMVIFPTLFVIQLSFKQWNLTERSVQRFVGLTNYVRILGDQRFWDALGRTMLYVVLSTGATLILGFVLALLLNRNLRAKGLLRTALIVPMVVTPVVVGLTWRFMYNPELGMINYLLGLLGFQARPFLGETTTSLLALIATEVWEYTPFVMLILLAGLESLSPVPFEAAMIDGATNWQMLRYLTLPLMKTSFLVAILFRVMQSFSAFDTIFVMTGGGPGRASETLMMYVYRLGFEHWHMGEAAAVGIIMLVILTVIAKVIIGAVRKD